MLSSITWHTYLSLSLSIAVDVTPHAIVAITLPATTILTILFYKDGRCKGKSIKCGVFMFLEILRLKSHSSPQPPKMSGNIKEDITLIMVGTN